MDIPNSIEDDEGNISMFLAQPHDYDQVVASNKDLNTSHIQQFGTCEASENRDVDVATLDPLFVTPPPERDSNSPSLDLQITTPTQLHNNTTGLDIDTYPSQSCESDTSEEQVGRNLANVRHHQNKRNRPITHSLAPP
jgi:hypothetical protein